VPAIQPARLKDQAVQLAEQFDRPPEFVRGLHSMLEFYADRVHHPGQAGKPKPLTEAYKVHPPVLRQILQELVPLAAQNTTHSLTLCDALWQQPFLEFRQLACMLLGQIPVENPEAVTQRLQAWITPELENDLVDALLTNGLAYLRLGNPQAIILMLQDWLERVDLFYQQLGLRALLPMINDPSFENLPTFFRIVHPLARSAPPVLRPDVLDVLAAFAHRSPQETAYFLRQTLALPDSPDTPWMIRQILKEFPPEIQERLRQEVRGL
jgi:hypothetical protein